MILVAALIFFAMMVFGIRQSVQHAGLGILVLPLAVAIGIVQTFLL